MLKINIFWAVFKKPLRMRRCFLFGPYFMPFFNGQFLKCDILPVSNDPMFIHSIVLNHTFLSFGYEKHPPILSVLSEIVDIREETKSNWNLVGLQEEVPRQHEEADIFLSGARMAI